MQPRKAHSKMSAIAAPMSAFWASELGADMPTPAKIKETRITGMNRVFAPSATCVSFEGVKALVDKYYLLGLESYTHQSAVRVNPGLTTLRDARISCVF